MKEKIIENGIEYVKCGDYYIPNLTDTSAKDMVDKLIKDMAVKQGITEELKAKDQMAWVSAMNNIRHSAEEIVMHDIVCCKNLCK